MKKNISNYYNDLITDISELLKISTVYDSQSVSKEMPYGKNVYRGYQWMKQKALHDGFEVMEYDCHALAIRIPGNKSQKRIDAVSHIDVVEPGRGWTNDPFSGHISNGFIYGRGAQDMKGSLLITYYALKYIMDNEIPLDSELRVVIGCDEERTMDDMRYYISKAGEPEFAFTPDGRFPYSMGEKGALMWTLAGSYNTCIKTLDGGVQCNVVSPMAEALVDDINSYQLYIEMLSKLSYQGEILKEDDMLRIKITGKAAHASRPDEGVNASVQLLRLISEVSSDNLASLLCKCFEGNNGEGADIYYDIEPMGKLTLNLGILKIENGMITAEVDCRYPYGVASETLTEKLKKAINPLNVELKYDDKPTLSDSTSPYLKTLLQVYREAAGKPDAQPVLGMGVTYSKAFRNCVAFGPTSEGDLVLAHQADECIEISKLETLLDIYTRAMISLANLK